MFLSCLSRRSKGIPPVLRTHGSLVERSIMVDSIPIWQAPPSSIRSIEFPSDSRTCSAFVGLTNPDLLAQEYLFHNSNFALRPMWTYQAEKYGSKIIFYFYSINQRTFTKSDGFIPKAPRFFKSAIWPHYLAWDKHHADFIKKSTTNNPIVDITEPIPFNNSLIDLPYLPNNSIAVFDIQPYRNVFYKTLLFELDYYIPFTVNLFINELYEVINELRGTLAFKQKRDIGRAAHHKYINNIKNYKNKENFIFINTKTSAFDLIKNTKATISMPFTSTAHLAKVLVNHQYILILVKK